MHVDHSEPGQAIGPPKLTGHLRGLAADIKENLFRNTSVYPSYPDEVFQHSERNAGIVCALHFNLDQLAIRRFAE